MAQVVDKSKKKLSPIAFLFYRPLRDLSDSNICHGPYSGQL